MFASSRLIALCTPNCKSLWIKASVKWLNVNVLAFVGLSRLDVWFRFPREFHVLIRFFVSGVTWSVRVSSGLSVGNTWYRWNCRVTSRESSISSAGVEFVVLWCYGPSILWIRLDGWFSRCRGRSPADWLSGRPCTKTMKGRSKSKRARTGREFSGVQKMFKSGSRERFATGALFSTVQLGPAHGRLVESDCPYGAEPRPCPGFLGLMSKWSNISLIPWKIQTYRFYICLVTHDAKV